MKKICKIYYAQLKFGAKNGDYKLTLPRPILCILGHPGSSNLMFMFLFDMQPVPYCTDYKYIGATINEFIDYNYTAPCLADSAGRELSSIITKIIKHEGSLKMCTQCFIFINPILSASFRHYLLGIKYM